MSLMKARIIYDDLDRGRGAYREAAAQFLFVHLMDNFLVLFLCDLGM